MRIELYKLYFSKMFLLSNWNLGYSHIAFNQCVRCWNCHFRKSKVYPVTPHKSLLHLFFYSSSTLESIHSDLFLKILFYIYPGSRIENKKESDVYNNNKLKVNQNVAWVFPFFINSWKNNFGRVAIVLVWSKSFWTGPNHKK